MLDGQKNWRKTHKNSSVELNVNAQYKHPALELIVETVSAFRWVHSSDLCV